MKMVNIHEAKSQLSRLIKKSLEGEEVIIAKAGKPLIKLIPVEQAVDKDRVLGHARGVIEIEDSFFEPLPPDIEILFNQ